MQKLAAAVVRNSAAEAAACEALEHERVAAANAAVVAERVSRDLLLEVVERRRSARLRRVAAGTAGAGGSAAADPERPAGRSTSATKLLGRRVRPLPWTGDLWLELRTSRCGYLRGSRCDALALAATLCKSPTTRTELFFPRGKPLTPSWSNLRRGG